MHNGMARNYSLTIPACQNTKTFDEEDHTCFGYGAQRSGEIGFENSTGYCYQPAEQMKCETSIWVSM